MSKKLNGKQIKSILRKKVPGRFSASNGLYFRVTKKDSGFLVVRYSVNNIRREISLGRYPDLSLADTTIETAKIK
jgi:hypothetical protein